MSRLTRLRLIELTYFAFLAALILNVLLLNISTHVPGPESDYYHFHWNYWWARHAIFDLRQSVYFTDYLHVPYSQNLAYHTLTIVWLPLYIVLESIAGQIMTVNLIVWLNLFLSGCLCYVFLRSEALPRYFALIGATLFVASPYMVGVIEKFHLNLLALFWLPATALLWRQVVRTHRIAWAVVLGITFWLAWLTDPQWLLWIAFFLLPYAVMTLWNASSTRPYRIIPLALGALSVAIMLTLAWIIAPIPQMLAWEGDVLPAPIDSTRPLSLNLDALWGGENSVRIGYWLVFIALLMIILPLRRWVGTQHAASRRVTSPQWIMFLAGCAALLLALGPDITLLGQTIPMPYRWLHDTLNGIYRAPVRFLPVAYLTFVLFFGWVLRFYVGAHGCAPLRRTLFIAIFWLFLIVDSHILKPLPIFEVPQYDFYQTIAADPTDTVVEEVPINVSNGWTTVGSIWNGSQFYGTQHEKRITSGFVAREPSNNFLYYELSPLWNWLAGNTGLDYDAARLEFEQAALAFPIGYIIVSQWDKVTNQPYPQATEWLGFFNSLESVCYWLTEKDRVVYRSTSHPEDCPAYPVSRVDIGTPDDLPHIGLNWHYVEEFGGRTARWMATDASLYLTPQAGTQQVSFEALAFQETRDVEVWIEEAHIGTVTVTPDGWQTFTLPVPPLSDRIRLRFLPTTSATPAEVGVSPDTRVLSIAVSDIWFE